MSSYLNIRIIRKNDFEEYLNQCKKLEESNVSYWDDKWSKIYKIISDNSFVLAWSSRSFKLYRVFEDNIGYTTKSTVINKDDLESIAKQLQKEFDEYYDIVTFYKKHGYMKTDIKSKRIKEALEFLDSIKPLVNEEKLEDVKTIIFKNEIDDDYNPYIEEYEDELYDIEHAKTLIDGLLLIYNYMDEDSCLIYDMD